MPSEAWTPALALAIRLSMSVWLISLSVCDVRRRQLPHALTTLPLLIVGGLAAIRGLSAEAGQGWNDVALGLALAAVLLSDALILASLPAAAALGVVFVLGSAPGQVTVVAWLVALALALAGVWGAGDAKIVMILLAVFPDVRLAGALVCASVVGGLGVIGWRLRGATPYYLLALARDALRFRFPARTGAAGQFYLPLAPVLAGGALVYVWGLG